MLFDPRPFLSWWADRKGKTDPNFRTGRIRVFLTIVVMLALLPLFPDWLVISGVAIYWLVEVLRSDDRFHLRRNLPHRPELQRRPPPSDRGCGIDTDHPVSET